MPGTGSGPDVSYAIMIMSLYTTLYAHYLSGSFSQTWEKENEAQ